MDEILMVVGAFFFVWGFATAVFQAVRRVRRSQVNGQDLVDIWLSQNVTIGAYSWAFIILGGLAFLVGLAMKAVPWIRSL